MLCQESRCLVIRIEIATTETSPVAKRTDGNRAIWFLFWIVNSDRDFEGYFLVV
jgi:hypothetical protein